MRDIIQQVSEIISPAYLVGGSVRDVLLGHPPKDYDFSTSLIPDEIEAAVRKAGKRPFLTGKRFGTVGFKLGEHFIEVTTFRAESYPERSRKPDVIFVQDITHDLSRRDFTINAMAMRPDGSIIDPFNGRGDLQQRRLHSVGNPAERFNEDPLRMLRAARFAAQLDFRVEPVTLHTITQKSDKILEVSKQRWTQELDKLLTSEHVVSGLDVLAETRLLNFMIPELAIQVDFDQDSPYHELDLWRHTTKAVSLTPRHLILRWASLLHDVGKPYTKTKNQRGYSNYVHHEQVGAELVTKIGTYLQWPKSRVKEVHHLVLCHLEEGSPLGEPDGLATKR